MPIPRLVPEGLTFGWLLDGAASGKIPGPAPLNAFLVSTYVRESFLAPAQVTAAPKCVRRAEALDARAPKGSEAHCRARQRRSFGSCPFGGTPSLPVTMRPSTVVALAGPLRLRIVAIGAGAMLCE